MRSSQYRPSYTSLARTYFLILSAFGLIYEVNQNLQEINHMNHVPNTYLLCSCCTQRQNFGCCHLLNRVSTLRRSTDLYTLKLQLNYPLDAFGNLDIRYTRMRIDNIQNGWLNKALRWEPYLILWTVLPYK